MTGLFLLALGVFLTGLGNVPLRDWDEGIVAQVAREIWRSPFASFTWLHPTYWAEPYFNKPPLVHGLIALTYAIAGVSEWTSRFPGALLTACSVPLLYAIGRELFQRYTPAVLATAVYLTTLPVVRQGRLAMLDGALLCFFLLMVWCLLRSRRDLRFALATGISLGLVCLTKGIMVGILLGAIALIFLQWDTPRLLRTPVLWLGLLLGMIPVGLWYGSQWLHYGVEFLSDNLVEQSFGRIWTPVEAHAGPPWYYVLELIKYGLPWLLFWPLGGKLAWEQRHLSWAKLVLVWSGVYLLAISLMSTKLPWYSLPLYPALSLIVGAQLTVLWNQGFHASVKQTPEPYPRYWIGLFATLAIASFGASFYLVWSGSQTNLLLPVMAAIMGVTFVVVALLVKEHNPQFIPVLIWGTYLALLLLMISPHWLWELAESYPVKPVAQLIQSQTLMNQKVFTSYPFNRPSLSFYSNRLVVPASSQQLQRQWQRQRPPYFLLDDTALKTWQFSNPKILGQAEGWTLVTRDRE
jgi:4-amino-4-deoxy-L-arabinose transferase-like glycosyltransferase